MQRNTHPVRPTGKVINNRTLELMGEKQRRTKKPVSLDDIMQETGLTRNTVQGYIRNQVTRFDAQVVIHLCNFLECDIADLLVIESAE